MVKLKPSDRWLQPTVVAKLSQTRMPYARKKIKEVDKDFEQSGDVDSVSDSEQSDNIDDSC